MFWTCTNVEPCYSQHKHHQWSLVSIRNNSVHFEPDMPLKEASLWRGTLKQVVLDQYSTSGLKHLTVIMHVSLLLNDINNTTWSIYLATCLAHSASSQATARVSRKFIFLGCSEVDCKHVVGTDFLPRLNHILQEHIQSCETFLLIYNQSVTEYK